MLFRQINLNHSRLASDELVKRASEYGDPFVFLVQEPYSWQNRVAGLNGAGNVFYLQSDDYRIRTCIVSSKNINMCPNTFGS